MNGRAGGDPDPCAKELVGLQQGGKPSDAAWREGVDGELMVGTQDELPCP
jgi:hypothetical protein